MNANAVAITGNFLHCVDDPRTGGQEAVEYIDDGMMLIEDGHISALGPVASIEVPSGAQQLNYRGKLIVPGFIDTHVHFPQVDVIASYGTCLLYTSPSPRD